MMRAVISMSFRGYKEVKKRQWANTTDARIRAYQAAADLLYEAAQDPDTFADEEITSLELRAAQFYLDKLANDMQKKAFQLEEYKR